MTRTVRTNTNTVSNIVWGCAASELTPQDGRGITRSEKTGRWVYPDGYLVRMMDGTEPIEVMIDGGRAVEIRAESWVVDRFGRPGHGLFGARAARRLGEALLK